MVSPFSSALAALYATGLLLAVQPSAAEQTPTLEDIRQLENLINAIGTETHVALECPPRHAGYYENDGRSIDRLVICKRHVDLGDVQAVWAVMAHEATHIMQSCTGGTVISDAMLPEASRELQTLAPHYAKLISRSYRQGEQRLEIEAFWMELQPPVVVLALFRRSCASFLQPGGAARRRPLPLPSLPAPQSQRR